MQRRQHTRGGANRSKRTLAECFVRRITVLKHNLSLEREREREREREGGESASIQIAKRVATGPSKPTHQCHGTFGMVRSVCPLEICNRVQRMLCQHHTTGRCGASFTLARTLHVEVVRVPLLSRRIEHHIHRVHTGVHREPWPRAQLPSMARTQRGGQR